MNTKRISELVDKAQATIRELAEEVRGIDDLTAANIDALADEVEFTIDFELDELLEGE